MAGPQPEEQVAKPMLLMRWDSLTFLHWPYRPEVVQRLLPDGLMVDTWDGRAWVAITPFTMAGVRGPGVPAVPWLSTFPETNLRTYVRDRAGRDGLWFFSLDTTRVASLAVRCVGVPYIWSTMSVRRSGGVVEYTTSRRRLPADPNAVSRVTIRPLSPMAPPEVGAFDHFLTGRWRAFSSRGGRMFVTPVEHEPWPLWHADVVVLEERAVAAAGLPPAAGAPTVHFSPGVDVRLGFPRRVGRPQSSRSSSSA